MHIRAQYNYDAMEASNDSGLLCSDKSLTQQHQKEESDINTIVRKFGLTGELPMGVVMPQYGDFTSVSDYKTALNAVMAAQAAFMRLPADVRYRFQNDPQLFVEFCSDPANKKEAEALGLIEKKAEPKEGVPPTEVKPNTVPAGATPAAAGA